MSITLQTILVQSPGASSTEIEDARVFLDVENGDYLSLKGPGLALWESLPNPLSVDALLELVSRRYGIDRERCERDSMPFLEELLAAGLIREASVEAAP